VTWGRTDDHADQDPRFCTLSLAAEGLYSKLRPVALRRDEDGSVFDAEVRRYAGDDYDALTSELRRSGAWERRRGQWRFTRWEEIALPASIRQQRKDAAAKRWAKTDEREIPLRTNDPSDAGASSSHMRSHSVRNAEPVPVKVVAKATPSPPTPQGVRRPNDQQVERFVEVWNANCAPLPTLRKPPEGAEKLRLVGVAVAYFSGHATELAAAIRRCAADEHYRKSGYGFEAFCRHVERWGAPTPSPETHVSNGSGNKPVIYPRTVGVPDHYLDAIKAVGEHVRVASA